MLPNVKNGKHLQLVLYVVWFVSLLRKYNKLDLGSKLESVQVESFFR